MLLLSLAGHKDMGELLGLSSFYFLTVKQGRGCGWWEEEWECSFHVRPTSEESCKDSKKCFISKHHLWSSPPGKCWARSWWPEGLSSHSPSCYSVQGSVQKGGQGKLWNHGLPSSLKCWIPIIFCNGLYSELPGPMSKRSSLGIAWYLPSELSQVGPGLCEEPYILKSGEKWVN